MEREQIGKAVLDYRFYTGEDKYTDGTIEDEMLEIAKNCAPEEYDRVITEKKSWPILYHFSALRENIISWFPVKKTDRVLEIGGGLYFIADILLRMLTPRELYNAMGFPPDYIIDRDYLGNEYGKTKQVARCGNAVCPPMATALVRANLPEWCSRTITTMEELEKAVTA